MKALWRLQAVQGEHKSFPPQIDLLLRNPELSKGFLDFVKSHLVTQLLGFVAKNATISSVQLRNFALLGKAVALKYKLSHCLVIFLGQ